MMRCKKWKTGKESDGESFPRTRSVPLDSCCAIRYSKNSFNPFRMHPYSQVLLSAFTSTTTLHHPVLPPMLLGPLPVFRVPLDQESSSTSTVPRQPSATCEQLEQQQSYGDRIGESARNRFGRPYISGRPLLLCDRQKIVRLHKEGKRKIAIAREIGITHSCVSKVIRRYEETGLLDSKNSRTASCACPGDAETHDFDLRICRHARFRQRSPQIERLKCFSIEWILSDQCPSKRSQSKRKYANLLR